MSGIVGLWNLDGRQLETSVLDAMSASIAHRGLDGSSRLVVGSVGFAHQRLWTTAEEMGEIQPLIGRDSTMLVMDGRLDNRDDLTSALGQPRSASDATLALAAFAAWDDGFAERLNGDFVVAVFDARCRRLILARDSIGLRPIYFTRTGRLFAFASEIKALLAHPDVPTRLDDEGIADYLLVSSRPIDRQDITCFEGISALVPAHVAVTTLERTVTRRYWDFDTQRTVRLRTFGEYQEGFREVFAQAVRRRIRAAGPVAVSVSGGLDSSSIFCQAETLRRSQQADCGALVGISWLGDGGTPTDEDRYVDAIEAAYGVRVERIAIEPLVGLTLNAAEQVRAAEAPFMELMWGASRELHRQATARGARVLLTGHWGDQVLFSSAYLIDLFHRGAWGMARRHAREHARWFGEVESRVLLQRFAVDLARYHLPKAFFPPLKWIRRRVLGVERPKPWFSDVFLRRALRFAGRPATIGDGFHSAHARAVYLEARSKYHVHCLEWHNKIGAFFGQDVSFPFLDRELLAFLMAIPGEMHAWNGAPRALAREAMRNVLPELVYARRGKADFSDYISAGVSRDAACIAQTLTADSLGVKLGYFDPERLRPAVARLSADLTPGDCTGSWDLADAFALEVWLRLFADARREGSTTTRSTEGEH
jgi:asparagine synthase (glutamine-hydrolysing)